MRPDELYEYTPREYANMVAGANEKAERDLEMMAIQAIMYRRAMNERRISIDDLVGRKQRNTRKPQRNDNVVSIEEKRAELAYLESTLGKAGERQ